MIPILFVGFAAVLVASSLMVVLHKNPVTSALFLVVAFCSLAGIYILQKAEFIGMVQVIVYAGAIMVLFLFVIMYLNLGHDQERGATILLRRLVGWATGLAVLALAAMLCAGSWALGPKSAEVIAPATGNTQALGQILYSRYLFPFEITSLLLLVAMVGAIVIARGRDVGREGAAIATGPRPPADPTRGMLRPGDVLTPPPPRGEGS